MSAGLGAQRAMSFTEINHYVPRWYQRRFISPTAREQKLYYLDLHPERVPHADGGFHVRNEIRRLGPESCFAEKHLYTLFFGTYAVDVIERAFFGGIDDRGANAVEFFLDYKLAEESEGALHDLIAHLGAQKLRTPKGLDLLRHLSGNQSRENALALMGNLQHMLSTIWMESVWEIQCCDASPTKFIVSDHPVTTYNKGLFPLSAACQYPLDAPVELVGTHTIFPMSLSRCLVLTNLGYVRDPKISPLRKRENARYFGQTWFDLRKIQTDRQITEEHVLAINYIVKTRARRYVAAGEKAWLFPEERLPTRKWDKLGDRFFLMPDPRKVSFSTDFVIGYKDGSAWGADEYGRRPGRDKTLKAKALREREWVAFQKSKQAWEQQFGKLSRDDLIRFT